MQCTGPCLRSSPSIARHVQLNRMAEHSAQVTLRHTPRDMCPPKGYVTCPFPVTAPEVPYQVPKVTLEPSSTSVSPTNSHFTKRAPFLSSIVRRRFNGPLKVLRSSSTSTVPFPSTVQFPRSSEQTLQTQCSPCI
jgi:hypothetical protein